MYLFLLRKGVKNTSDSNTKRAKVSKPKLLDPNTFEHFHFCRQKGILTRT